MVYAAGYSAFALADLSGLPVSTISKTSSTAAEQPVSLNPINDYLREAKQLSLPLTQSIALSQDVSAFAYRVEPPANAQTLWSVDYRVAESASSAVVLRLVTVAFDEHQRVVGFEDLLKKNAMGEIVLDEVLWPSEPIFVLGSANPPVPATLRITPAVENQKKLDANGAYKGNVRLATTEPVTKALEFSWTASAVSEAQTFIDVRLVAEPGASYTLRIRSGAKTTTAAGADGENLSYNNLLATNGKVQFSIRPNGKVFSPVAIAVTQQAAVAANQERELDKPQQLAFGQLSRGDISHREGTGVFRPETDAWLITVPEEPEGASNKPIDVQVTAANASHTVTAKLKQSGRHTPLFSKSAKSELTSGPLLLQPGQYSVEVSAEQVGTRYQVQVNWAQQQAANSEKEPNNTLADANVIAPRKVTKGQLTTGTDEDFFMLDTGGTGAAQYWRLIATGGGVKRMGLGSKYWISAHPDDNNPVLSMNYMLLLPGVHPIKLSGDGRYSFRAIPLGPPKPGFEIEPNDGKLGPSERLTLGATARGSLDKAIVSGSSDVDQYRFSVAKPGKYRITLVSPDDQGIRTRLYVNGDQWFSHQQNTTAGSTLEYAAKLLVGEYTIELTNQDKTRALDEYTLRVEQLADTADVNQEPNDIVGFATLLKESGTFTETLGAFDHSDCYAMAPTTAPSTLEFATTAKYRVMFLDRFSRPKSKLATRDTASPSPSAITKASAGTKSSRWTIKPLEETLFICVAREWNTDANEPYTLTVGMAGSSALPQSQRASTVLPDALKGGLNVAWHGLGATWEAHAEGLTPKAIAATIKKLNRGINNISPVGTGVEWDVYKNNANDYRLNLAGDDSIVLAGVVVNTRTSKYVRRKTRHFRLLVSDNGEDYTQALRGELGFTNNDQYFAFDKPVSARYIKFLPVDSFQSRSPHYARFQELKLIASPDFAPQHSQPDLASVAVGGHIVSHDFKPRVWNGADAMDAVILDPQKIDVKQKPFVCQFPPKKNQAEWVVGFHHNRAARITQLKYLSDLSVEGANHFDALAVSVSTQSPLGPWQDVGSWDKPQLLGSPDLPLADKPWVRFVKFVATGKQGTMYQCPHDIVVTEAPIAAGYRSILAEWSEYGAEGSYELANPPPATGYPAQGGATADRAVNITAAAIVKSSVKRERNDDWFLFKSETANSNDNTSTKTNSVLIRIAHPVSFKPRVSILDGSGEALQTTVEQTPPGAETDASADKSGEGFAVLPQGWTSTQYTAWRSDDANYTVHIQEPPRNVVLTWDASGSMGPQLPYIEMASRRWANYLKPDHEFAKLMQFAGKSQPENEWANLPHMLQAALHAVSSAKSNGSSDAENSFLEANELLAPRYGNHAVVATTDGQFQRSAAFWDYQKTHCSSMYGAGLGGGAPSEDYKLQGVYQDNFQNWVSACGGHYRYCDSVTCLEDFYEFAAQDIRKPKPYQLQVSEVYRAPPKPGLLSVKAGIKTLAATAKALYVILDASGSMLQQLEGKRRIDIAKATLKTVTRQSMGSHNQLGMRTFGLEVDECNHELALPIAKHSANAIDAAINKVTAVNKAKTPIAASLEAAATDLSRFSGEKLIVLLTDGEETCGGDSEAILNSLRAKDIDIKMHIVGFALDDAALVEQFKSWAVLGGGEYYDAGNQSALQTALHKAVTPRFEVRNSVGDIVLTAHLGDTKHSLPPGDYRVSLPNYPEIAAIPVLLKAEGEEAVTFK